MMPKGDAENLLADEACHTSSGKLSALRSVRPDVHPEAGGRQVVMACHEQRFEHCC
jgi:hypothetical protein